VSAGPSIAEVERRNRQTVLQEVLELLPNVVSEAELVQALGADPSNPQQVEPWRIAIRELGRCGLLRIDAKSVYPTLAALSFAELSEEWC
jgi:hypothetical protein